MNRTQKSVVASAAALFAIWLASNWSWIEADEDSLIRFVLGLLLSVLILLRPKFGGPYRTATTGLLSATAVIGACAAVLGIVFNVNQFEWLGIILVIYACLRWALPPRFGTDIVLAFALFYWIHPLPGQVFGALQIRMQIVSVYGSEWLLHILNHEAWADGIILWTGSQTFEVPEACSGMTTGVTVLLCSLGTAILLRFRWFEVIVLVGMGLIQVVALNIIRIAHMVVAAEGMPREWAESFLHDTLGAYLLVSIMLVQVEAGYWRTRRVLQIRKEKGIADGEVEREEKATILPLFWRLLVRWGLVIALLLALLAGSALAVYKRRPHHRAQMIARVVPSLLMNSPERGRAAARAVLAWKPDSHGVRSDLAKALVREGRYDDAIDELDMIPEIQRGPEHQMLRAWALFRGGDVPAAHEILEGLPRENAESPGADLLRTEIAVSRDEADLAAQHARGAARLRALLPRIRAMYPYFAGHEQWSAISETDRAIPYPSIEIADIAVRAHLRVLDPDRAAASLEVALEQWPDEPKFVDSVVALARLRPKSPWRTKFAALLGRNIEVSPPDRLAGHLLDSFDLTLPDLAWRVYRRLTAFAPDAPILDFAVAKYGDEWMTLLADDVGIQETGDPGGVDLFPIVRTTLGLPVFRGLWSAIPGADGLSQPDRISFKAAALARCLKALTAARARGELSSREFLLLADAQSLAGRIPQAHGTLREIASTFPELRGEAVVREAELYFDEQDWQSAYEILREYEQELTRSPMILSVLKANALLRMGFGALTLKTLQEAARNYPGTPQVLAMLAAFWDHVGEEEQALHLLRSHELDYSARLRTRLLHDTGRFAEARELASRTGVLDLPVPREADQRVTPVPAEWVTTRRWAPPLTAEQVDRSVAVLDEIATKGSSPFVRAIAGLEKAWLVSAGEDGSSDSAAWLQAGRDDDERGAALYKLLTLLAQYRHYERAEQVAEELAQVWPRAVPMWRSWIALSEGRRDIVDRAVEACPADSMVWLADIVTATEEKRTEDWMSERIELAVESGMVPSVIVRAADLMLRRGLHTAAAKAMRLVEENSQDHLPAVMIALRCALATGDRDRAVLAANRGAELAIEPWPFHSTMVDITFGDQVPSAHTIKALEYLRRHFESDLKWSRMLGDAYFRQGDMERALAVLKPAIRATSGALSPFFLLQAAEAARQAGKLGDAIEILRQADAMFPENVEVLNNLVYAMAGLPSTLSAARDLLESRLLKVPDPDFSILDTAGLVYIRSGEMDRARDFMMRALSMIDDQHPGWPETKLNMAEIYFSAGDLVRAQESADEVRAHPTRSAVVDLRSVDLLRRIRGERPRLKRESELLKRQDSE